jgi:ankyrin repeat protein
MITRPVCEELIAAVQEQDLKAVLQLLRLGCCPSFVESGPLQATPLHYAVCAHDIACLLIAAGANVHATDFEKMTPLHWAAVGAELRTIRVLLEAGANSYATDINYRTPFQIALIEARDDLILQALTKNTTDTKSSNLFTIKRRK